MDIEKTIEFLPAHQARLANENELFRAHQAAVRADHEAVNARQGQRISEVAGVLRDAIDHFEDASDKTRTDMDKLLESQKHTDEPLHALVQVVDEMFRRPQQ